ncbi:MAG: NAD kinase [Candidatus Heimdallarchaeota archaeon LC_2]|nr:MAG: NAD kinase [Candidatus Heimdallarchaeota archaeon LC_2]
MQIEIKGLCISSSDSDEYQLIEKLINELSPNTKIYDFTDVLEDFTILEKCDFILTIGGDGSVAWLVGIFFQKYGTVKPLKPIIPVVRPQSVGFLKQMDLEEERFKIGFTDLLNNKFHIRNRTILKSTICEQTYVAVNEIFLMSSPHLGQFTVSIQHNDEGYHPITTTMADGAMITTSLGSTGWGLSYKGQINLDEDSVELIFAGGIHSAANFTLSRKPIKIQFKLKNTIINKNTLNIYQKRRKQLGLDEDLDPTSTLEIAYGSRVLVDGRIVGLGTRELEIDSSDSIPFVFLHSESIVDKTLKLTKQPDVK